MKDKRDIFDKLHQYNGAADVANEHGYFALSDILKDKMEGIRFARDNYNEKTIIKEIRDLKEQHYETNKKEKTKEIMTLRENITRKIKGMEWVLDL